jgi:hypothetical protein
MLFDKGLRAAQCTGGLAGPLACLRSPFLYLPHDAILPGAALAGDHADLAAAVGPRPVRADGTIDGVNRRAPAGAPEPDQRASAQWLVRQVQ